MLQNTQFNCLTQQLEAQYIIPAIRLKLIGLLKKSGLKDSEIAAKLKITRAAVSQYKHSKRGGALVFPQEINKDIEKAALAIQKGKSVNFEILKLINKIKKSRYICIICKETTLKNIKNEKKSLLGSCRNDPCCR